VAAWRRASLCVSGWTGLAGCVLVIRVAKWGRKWPHITRRAALLKFGQTNDQSVSGKSFVGPPRATTRNKRPRCPFGAAGRPKWAPSQRRASGQRRAPTKQWPKLRWPQMSSGRLGAASLGRPAAKRGRIWPQLPASGRRSGATCVGQQIIINGAKSAPSWAQSDSLIFHRQSKATGVSWPPE